MKHYQKYGKEPKKCWRIHCEIEKIRKITFNTVISSVMKFSKLKTCLYTSLAREKIKNKNKMCRIFISNMCIDKIVRIEI